MLVPSYFEIWAHCWNHVLVLLVFFTSHGPYWHNDWTHYALQFLIGRRNINVLKYYEIWYFEQEFCDVFFQMIWSISKSYEVCRNIHVATSYENRHENVLQYVETFMLWSPTKIDIRCFEVCRNIHIVKSYEKWHWMFRSLFHMVRDITNNIFDST